MSERKTLTIIPRPPRKRKFKRAVAEPVRFTEEIGDYICEQIANGRSLQAICKEERDSEEGFPTPGAVIYWVTQNIGGFEKKYKLACQIRAELHKEELRDIVDDGTNDFYEVEGKDGKTHLAFNAEHVQRSKLRYDFRKWEVSKLIPAYQDATQIRHADAEGKQLPQQPPSVVIVPVQAAQRTEQGI